MYDNDLPLATIATCGTNKYFSIIEQFISKYQYLTEFIK